MKKYWLHRYLVKSRSFCEKSLVRGLEEGREGTNTRIDGLGVGGGAVWRVWEEEGGEGRINRL